MGRRHRRCSGASSKLNSSSSQVVPSDDSRGISMDRRCTSSSGLKSSSSSQSVVLQDDDLLTLILLRVPPTKLRVLKCVSRQWHSLITTPHFRSLLPSFRASALFIQHTEHNSKFYSVSLDDSNTPLPIRNHTFAHDRINDLENIKILSSCNGLLLCSIYINSHGRRIYVYDISTGQLTILPKHPRRSRPGICYVGLAFDPSKSLHYKVISFFYKSESDVAEFYVYSSETGTWRVSIQSYLQSLNVSEDVYCNGCLHWLSEYSGSQPVSDSRYFDVDEERLETFPSPPISGRSRAHSYFGESEDHLHYAEVYPRVGSFSVYELKSDYSEWFVKYQIDLVPISKAFPEMKGCPCCTRICDDFNAAVVSLIRRENSKEDSFLVLELPGKIIRYNLVDRSFKVIWDFVADLKVYRHRCWLCGRFNASLYIE